MAIVLDSKQVVTVIVCQEEKVYEIEYPKSHYGSFINDLVNFGEECVHEINNNFDYNDYRYTEKEIDDEISEFWTDKGYGIRRVE